MLKNYFTTAIRSLQRNVAFSIIHVLGLSIGISASLVIYLIVRYENSFDKFEPQANQVYRLVMGTRFNGDEGHSAAVPAPAANAIQTEISGVEVVVPIMQFQGDATATVVINKINQEPVAVKKQKGIVFTNDQYFELMPFAWIAGNPESSLKNPFSVVLTESRAKQYFPDIQTSEIIGKSIRYNNQLDLFVTGIVHDLQEASDLTSAEFISYSTIEKTSLQDQFMMNVWNDWMAYSTLYLRLSPGSSSDQVMAQLNAMFKKYNPSAAKDANNYLSFKLQPLHDIHFNTRYAGFDQRIASKKVLFGLLALAAFLLLLGCINFTNLATAQSSKRAHEIGIRKTVGSSKKQLVFQFLLETFLTTLFATILSLCMAPILLQLFNDFIPPGLTFDISKEPSVLFFLFLLTLLVTFLAGLYPALFLSAYRPAAVLRNQAFAGGATRSATIRKGLTVAQFVIAQFFVMGAFMVSKQIHYSMNQDLGFSKDAIVNFEIPRDTASRHHELLMTKISSLPGVQLVSNGFLPPAIPGAAFSNIAYNDGTSEIKINVQLRFGDERYLDVYKITLAAGRNIRSGKNINETLINETYARELGFQQPADAIGKELTFSNGTKIPIVGVIHDFHQSSFHSEIGPIVFQSRVNGSFFHVALQPQQMNGGQWQNTIAEIQKIVTEVYPDLEFNYQFFDDSIAQLYAQEKDTSTLLNWATGLSSLISCMGLLGLVMYTSETRKKEIGIRKLLGATVRHIVSLLSLEFIQLVAIAFVIASPIAWWATDKWLQNFAYRTSMSWWVFAACGSMLLLLAIITLSVQTIKTARSNPVNSLRTE